MQNISVIWWKDKRTNRDVRNRALPLVGYRYTSFRIAGV